MARIVKVRNPGITTKHITGGIVGFLLLALIAWVILSFCSFDFHCGRRYPENFCSGAPLSAIGNADPCALEPALTMQNYEAQNGCNPQRGPVNPLPMSECTLATEYFDNPDSEMMGCSSCSG